MCFIKLILTQSSLATWEDNLNQILGSHSGTHEDSCPLGHKHLNIHLEWDDFSRILRSSTEYHLYIRKHPTSSKKCTLQSHNQDFVKNIHYRMMKRSAANNTMAKIQENINKYTILQYSNMLWPFVGHTSGVNINICITCSLSTII
jgi:hypothetical protein